MDFNGFSLMLWRPHQPHQYCGYRHRTSPRSGLRSCQMHTTPHGMLATASTVAAAGVLVCLLPCSVCVCMRAPTRALSAACSVCASHTPRLPASGSAALLLFFTACACALPCAVHAQWPSKVAQRALPSLRQAHSPPASRG